MTALQREPGGPWPSQNFGWVGHNAFGSTNNWPVCSLLLYCGQLILKTRQLSYRKEDRAMRPIYGCPGKFLRVLTRLTTHPATFPEICNALLFQFILRMCVQNWKFVALPVPEIIGGTRKISAAPGYAHAPFSPKILKGVCSDGPCEYTCQI